FSTWPVSTARRTSESLWRRRSSRLTFPEDDRVQRPPPPSQQHQSQHCRENAERQLHAANGGKHLILAGVVGIMERIRKLNDKGGDKHRSGEQRGVDPREKAYDQKDPANQLTVRSDIAEGGRDAVGGEVLGEVGDSS